MHTVISFNLKKIQKVQRKLQKRKKNKEENPDKKK